MVKEKLERNMLYKNSMLVSLLYLTFAMLNTAESLNDLKSPQCRTNMTSLCPNYAITKWNRKDVSQSLKKWIRSVSIEWNVDKFAPGGRHCKGNNAHCWTAI